MNRMEQGWLTGASLTVLGATVVSGASVEVALTSLVGIVFVVLVAFKQPVANLFGAMLAVMFGYLSYQQGYFMNALTNIFYVAPASLFGWWYWSKNKDKPVSNMKDSDWKFSLLIFGSIIGMALMAWYAYNSGSNHFFIDGITGFLPLAATLLLILRYREQWLLWIPYNALEVFLWFSAASADSTVFAILVMRMVFFVNSILGSYVWYKDE